MYMNAIIMLYVGQGIYKFGEICKYSNCLLILYASDQPVDNGVQIIDTGLYQNGIILSASLVVDSSLYQFF